MLCSGKMDGQVVFTFQNKAISNKICYGNKKQQVVFTFQNKAISNMMFGKR